MSCIIQVASLKTYEDIAQRKKKINRKTVKDNAHGNIREFQKGDKVGIYW